MHRNFLELLACPDCHVAFDVTVTEEDNGQIRSGFLRCRKKQCSFPIIRYVPRFVEANRYAASFSKQREYVRRHFKEYIEDRSGHTLFLPTTGFDAARLRQGITLEVGCGYGRFVNVVRSLGGTIVGIDISTNSIDLAQDFVGFEENVHLAQCDLFRVPFNENAFDRIYSIGVLHHTPLPKDAFEGLVPFLRRPGQISIWVYPPEMKSSSNRWRVVTTRMPHSLLYFWCIVNQTLFSWIRGLPGGWRFNMLVPGCIPAQGRSFWLRVMSDFDDLSPQYASVHTNEEIREWFLEAGLHDVEVLRRSTSVTGWTG